MTYQPKPIDTSAVRLDPSPVELTEFLAENAREIWPKATPAKAGPTPPRATRPPNGTRTSCRAANCPTRRSSTTGTPRYRRSS
jgi:hypothetical protein